MKLLGSPTRSASRGRPRRGNRGGLRGRACGGSRAASPHANRSAPSPGGTVARRSPGQPGPSDVHRHDLRGRGPGTPLRGGLPELFQVEDDALLRELQRLLLGLRVDEEAGQSGDRGDGVTGFRVAFEDDAVLHGIPTGAAPNKGNAAESSLEAARARHRQDPDTRYRREPRDPRDRGESSTESTPKCLRLGSARERVGSPQTRPPTADEFEAILDADEAEDLQALAESLDHRAEQELAKATRGRRS